MSRFSYFEDGHAVALNLIDLEPETGSHPLTSDDLKGTPALITLLLVNNNITHIHENAFPPTIRKLHVGFNNLTSLNNSLRGLTDLNWLFLNNNRLKSLEGQLGTLSKLQLLVIEQNQLEALPSDIQLFSQLGSLYANNNRITSLDGLLRGLTKLQVFNMDFNQITMVRRDEFQNLHNLDSISLQNNQITSMNSSLSGLTKLAYLYLSHNQLTEFLLDDIRGLKRLRTVDLSYNKINKFGTRNEGKVRSRWYITPGLYFSSLRLPFCSFTVGWTPKIWSIHLTKNRCTKIGHLYLLNYLKIFRKVGNKIVGQITCRFNRCT
ncbi:biglycan-like [Diaphorina citri]|uniref:Biglycan-like n=1 Tax=Diaphorina citri TaxID=121845 RepID=A0A1S3DRQ7_DIACI|nr:biglycan-like [Diaphorina citri]